MLYPMHHLMSAPCTLMAQGKGERGAPDLGDVDCCAARTFLYQVVGAGVESRAWQSSANMLLDSDCELSPILSLVELGILDLGAPLALSAFYHHLLPFLHTSISSQSIMVN